MVEALDLGANDYVTKPVDYAVALARIRTQLTARRADPLTGLPNRVLFMDRLDAVLTRQPRRRQPRLRRASSSTSIASRSSTTASGTSPAMSCSSSSPAACSTRCGRPTPWRGSAATARSRGSAATSSPSSSTACRRPRKRRRSPSGWSAVAASPFDAAGPRGRDLGQHRHRDERRPLSRGRRTCCATPTRRCIAPRSSARRAARSSTPRCWPRPRSGC